MIRFSPITRLHRRDSLGFLRQPASISLLESRLNRSDAMISLVLFLALQVQCVDYSKDPAGCQPSTFDTPVGQMPSVRVNRQGNLDPFSSEQDARAGAALLEAQMHLFRNFVHLHWVIT